VDVLSAAWTLRPAGDGDRPFLLALRRATMDPHFARLGLARSDDEHRLRIDHRFDAASIVERDGRAIGLFKVVRDATPWVLEQIQLLPEAQGSGLGGALLADLVAQARAARAPIELHVLKGNPARRLYERAGFEARAEHEHGVTMVLDIAPAP